VEDVTSSLKKLPSVLEDSALALKLMVFDLECMKKEKDEEDYE